MVVCCLLLTVMLASFVLKDKDDTSIRIKDEDWDASIDIYSLSNCTWSWCCNLQFCASIAPTPRWGECLISNMFTRAFNKNRYTNIYYTFRRHSDIGASQYALTGPEEAYNHNTPFEFPLPRAVPSKVCIHIFRNNSRINIHVYWRRAYLQCVDLGATMTR